LQEQRTQGCIDEATYLAQLNGLQISCLTLGRQDVAAKSFRGEEGSGPLKPAFSPDEIEGANRNENMLQATKDLGTHLFEKRADLGYVGCWDNEIHVYVHANQEIWKAKYVAYWKGYPVSWHYDIGIASAFEREKK
jgi:hypothetical protein